MFLTFFIDFGASITQDHHESLNVLPTPVSKLLSLQPKRLIRTNRYSKQINLERKRKESSTTVHSSTGFC